MRKQKIIQGLVKRHPDGFGFLIPEDREHPDVYLPRQTMEGVMSGDRVMASVEPERGSDRYRGDVVKVVSRGVKRIVGHYARLNEKTGLVRDEGKGWGEDLRVNAADSMNAKNGDLVAAEITTYPSSNEKFAGKIVEVIGDLEDPMNDIRRVIHTNQIPEIFPPEVLAEAKKYKEKPEEADFKGRKDLRDKNLITIDGATAKDFDDAVLVETTPQGFRAWVAIADVSHYVRPGSEIDKEAYNRGTSVYFPNFVVPMLPEVLSNGLCSLNPHVPRLCLVAEMTFDHSGVMTGSEFYEGVMESKARVTYGKAQEVIDGTVVPELEHVKETILRCADLSKILMAKRFREGSLDLEIPETTLQIDGAGRPIDVIRSERLFAHRLIEELMLAANVAVAKFFTEREIAAMYRIHEPPNELAMGLLERYMTSFGGRADLHGEAHLQKKLTKALSQFEGKPEAQVLHILTLRSMNQAKYSMNNVGHFGLGFADYTHFTSPIRRYPDLIVHRLLKSQIMKGSSYRLVPEDDLATAGEWLSGCEQRSAKAERQLMSIKKSRFMQQFLGREFTGVVSGVARFGAFVLLREYDIDGLVRMDEMGDGRWEFNEDDLSLVSKGSGFSIRVGDTMTIIVAAAEPSTGQVTFTPVAATSSRKLQFASGGEKRFNEGGKPKERGARDERPRSSGSKPQRRDERQARDDRGRRGDRNRDRDRDRDRDRNADRNRNRGNGSATGNGGGNGSERKERESGDYTVRTSGRSLASFLKPKNKESESSGRRSETQSSGKNSKERRAGADDRGGVREARVSQRGGKGPSGKVSGGKTGGRRRR